MSIGLTGTTESLQIVLGANTTTNPVAYATTWADQGGAISDNTGTIATTTATTIVAAPGASVNRAVAGISIVNQDTVAATITINKVAATSARIIRIVLQAGTQLYYENGYGWFVLDGNGNILNSSALPAGITLNQPNIVGVTNGTNANAGSVGEYVNITTSGATVGASGAMFNGTSISLTAGDWDVSGNGQYIGTVTDAVVGLSTISATFGGVNTYAELGTVAGVVNPNLATPSIRLNLTVTTTVFLVGRVNYSVAPTVNVAIVARRAR
jgi:hypothetical protein